MAAADDVNVKSIKKKCYKHKTIKLKSDVQR